MHRDIKPHNIAIDPDNNKLRIIDWGLAEFYHPNIDYNVRVASRHFKAPELLVNMRYYDYSLDMWAFGCVLAGMIFRIHPFFHGCDNIDQLIKICKVLGTDTLREYTQKYNITLDSNLTASIGKYPVKPFSKYITSNNADLANPLALDILSKVLVFDHQQRLSAKEALQHPYFDPVRHTKPTRYNSLTDTSEWVD
uniref:non-specific serine/threonine protein kinase n=1 Tax=Lygus hesperus TaxID=30085 RepID=A0A146M280_LYGHE